jgi:hypothetical protein
MNPKNTEPAEGGFHSSALLLAKIDIPDAIS